MLEPPVATLVAKPWLPSALLMVATEPSDESHWTEPVYVLRAPVSESSSCRKRSVVPRAMVGIAG